jgi:hypothetical protein
LGLALNKWCFFSWFQVHGVKFWHHAWILEVFVVLSLSLVHCTDKVEIKMGETAKNESSDRPLEAKAAPTVLTSAVPADTKTLSDGKAVVARSPNFMASRRVLPELIEAAIERGVRVILTKSGYELDGFYKAGPMKLEPDTEQGGLVAIDRKDVTVPVKLFDDLVRLNYECWKKSRDKGAAYINPGREWVEEFSRLNLVKRQVIFVPGED